MLLHIQDIYFKFIGCFPVFSRKNSVTTHDCRSSSDGITRYDLGTVLPISRLVLRYLRIGQFKRILKSIIGLL